MTEAEVAQFTLSIVALCVSGLAFAGAAYSLGWQIYRHYRWGKPSLVVTGTRGIMTTQDGPRQESFWELEVIVVNVGDIRTQIEDVYWEFENPKRGLFRVKGSIDDDATGLSMDGRGLTFEGDLDPQPPLEIDRFGARRWLFRRSARGLDTEDLRTTTRGRPCVKWVSRTAVEPEFGENPHIVTAVGEWQTYRPLPWSELVGYDPTQAQPSAGSATRLG